MRANCESDLFFRCAAVLKRDFSSVSFLSCNSCGRLAVHPLCALDVLLSSVVKLAKIFLSVNLAAVFGLCELIFNAHFNSVILKLALMLQCERLLNIHLNSHIVIRTIAIRHFSRSVCRSSVFAIKGDVRKLSFWNRVKSKSAAIGSGNMLIELICSWLMTPINSNWCSGWSLMLKILVLKMYCNRLLCFIAGSVGCRNSNRVIGVYWRIAVLVLKLNVFNFMFVRLSFSRVKTVGFILCKVCTIYVIRESAYRELRHLFAIVGSAESDLWRLTLIYVNAVVGIANLLAVQIQLWRQIVAFCALKIWFSPALATRNKGIG